MKISVKYLGGDKEGAFPALLRVELGKRRLEREFDFGLSVQVLWSPEANRFAITGSAQGAGGQFRTAVVDITPMGIRWTDLTALVEKAFGSPVKCWYPEVPNIVALRWLSKDQLVVVAQIINHSNCDSYGTFVAYQIRISAQRIERTYGQLDVKRIWGLDLGSYLATARDECIIDAAACYVPSNHPELEPLDKP